MTVKELNRDQLIQLKQNYICDTYDRVYWSDLAAADELISDSEIFAVYADINFTNDDFFN